MKIRISIDSMSQYYRLLIHTAVYCMIFKHSMRLTLSTFVQAVFIQTVAVYMCHLLFESFFHKKEKNTDQSQRLSHTNFLLYVIWIFYLCV